MSRNKPKFYCRALIQIVAAGLYLGISKRHFDSQDGTYFAVFGLASLIKMAIMMAISYGINALTAKKPPKPQHAKPAGLEQFELPTAEEGRPLQILFGKKEIKGPNVIYYGSLKTYPIVKDMS